MALSSHLVCKKPNLFPLLYCFWASPLRRSCLCLLMVGWKSGTWQSQQMNLVVRGKQGGRTNKYIYIPPGMTWNQRLFVSWESMTDGCFICHLPRKTLPTCSPSPPRIQSGLRNMYSPRPGPHNRAVCARSIVICMFIRVWWVWLLHPWTVKSHSSTQPARTCLLGWFVRLSCLCGYCRVRPRLFLLCVIKPTTVSTCNICPLSKWD